MKIALSWSGGKDAALAHHFLKERYPDAAITWFTVLSGSSQRVTMHGVRPELISAQAAAAKVAVLFFTFQEQTDAAYGQFFSNCCEELAATGHTHMAFGDIFLEDLKQYRETLLSGTGLIPLFPIWGLDTTTFPKLCERLGIKAVICALSAQCMAIAALGQEYTPELMQQSAMPGTDLAGEQGEFHTWVFETPWFQQAIPYQKGEIRTHTYQYAGADSEFAFVDLQV